MLTDGSTTLTDHELSEAPVETGRLSLYLLMHEVNSIHGYGGKLQRLVYKDWKGCVPCKQLVTSTKCMFHPNSI